MSKGMLLYTARLVGERAIALGLFLLASHGVMGARALVWFVTYFVSVASAVWLYRTSADTLERRANIAATKDFLAIIKTTDITLDATFKIKGIALPRTLIVYGCQNTLG